MAPSVISWYSLDENSSFGDESLPKSVQKHVLLSQWIIEMRCIRIFMEFVKLSKALHY